MQIDINVKTYSTKQRILAFFMAFMIFSLTCPEIFEGLGVGLIVHAANSPIDIHSDVKDGSVMQGKTSGIYTYTGKFTKAAVSMFDYVSDEEINGTVVESHTNSYNNIWHKIPTGGFDNAFIALNQKISHSEVVSEASENITIKFTSNNVNTRRVFIHLWNAGSYTTSWPGVPMDYDPVENVFYYTLKYSNSGSNHKLGFIFNGGGDNSTGKVWQTVNIEGDTFDKGNMYCYTRGANTNTGTNPVKYNYIKDATITDGALPIYKSAYSVPLYFGTFYNGDAVSFYTDNTVSYNNGSTKPGGNGVIEENSVIVERASPYNNFWWRANIGFKPQGKTADLNNSVARGNASVQGLVGQTLSGGNLTDPNDSSIILPYLNETWSKSNSDVVKYYNADSNGGGVINFPFYEVKAAASGNVGNSSSSNIQGTYYSSYYGTGTPTTQYARFYQFDSSESNLYFHTDVAKKKGYFSETTTPINSNLSNVGFFPFNSSNSTYGKANNRGFGAKYEMQFKLKNDGCVGVVDSSGNDLDPSEYKTRIDTIFDFVGDDDLWVFVDGTLILDMGGSHNKSAGSINFKTKQATVKRAVSIGSSDSDKDNLDVDGVETPYSITTKLQTANSKTFVDNDPSKGYNENTTHTMTIFYMERGMNDSNLKIRFNYSPEANFSKMKITEYTDFSGVNDGLVSYTKKAAEDDIFKYTVSNKNTSKSDIYNSSAKYPTAEACIRTNEADSNLTTKLVNGSSQTQTISNFNPPGTLNTTTGIWSKVNEFKRVSGTSYLWVDGFANNKKMVGITTGSNASNTTGAGDSGGELYLMYGTNNDIYNSKAEGQESSAEFEKQFSKNSTMLVLQDSNLYSPKRMDGSIPVSPGLISNTNGNLFSALTDNGRDVADYYTTTVRLVDREFAENKTLVDDGVNDCANNTLNNGGQFLFANAPNGSSADLPVMLTEYFTNAVKTADLEIKKTVTGNTNKTDFGFEIELSNVFGISTAAVNNHGELVSTKNSGTATTSNISGTNKGTFTLQNGDTLTISGIPVHTKYKIKETSGRGQTVTGEIEEQEIPTTANGTTIKVTVQNNFQSDTGVDVLKTNNSTPPTPLEGAELELWYKETSTPPTYHFNDPKVVPYKMNGMKISKSPSEIGIPGLEEVRSSYTVYTEKTSYSNPDVPSSKDTDWILPRSDSDYIYFRDYNVGQYTADNDKVSFHSNTANSNAGKRSWRETFFADKSDGTHQQDQELGFADNDSYWYAAEFYGTNKETVKYAMWERFVDDFTYRPYGANADTTVDTVVWKIQPPDGYNQVRFILLQGDNWIRSTEKISFKLGEIYHKTNWGGVYSNGNYYDVPLNDEAHNLWAPTANGTPDQRNTAMEQPRKYEPTNQKIIFHCNSQQVWHNIHIEFFTNSSGTRVNGQAFPGYMMEPYAYAGSDYRMNDGYLTYELTIPNGATHFRINNGVGVDDGPYSYMTAITPIIKDQPNVKNGGNYYYLGSSISTLVDCLDDVSHKQNITLTANPSAYTSLCKDDTTKTYSESNITSDCDYVYFEAPSGWNQVYAYFYGGGNLRDDNWQRACYSAWPGIAPVGTEYEMPTGTDYVHSDTYSIKIDANADSNDDGYPDDNTGEYNGTNKTGTLSPEATFTLGGKTIYRFRLPKGDDKNYSKVVFNDGLKNFGGGHETGVIDYQAGYIYNESGTATQYYKYSPTVTYTGRTNSKYTTDDKTEYVYVKNSQNWKNLHITFYDSNGNRILQDGCGYLMDYAGKLNNVEYYRMPIPTNAAKFSVNQGKDTTATPKCDIIRYSEHATAAAPISDADATASDKFVYDLNNTTLSRLTYSKGSSTSTVSTTTGQIESNASYENYDEDNPNACVRQTAGTPVVYHTLNIRDSATTAWNVPIGGMTVTFYGENGTSVGSGTMMKTNPDGDSKVWYTKKIPEGAKSFSVIYVKNGTTTPTPTYPIYSTSADANGNITTSGHMYYATSGTNQLDMIHTESAVQEADDETYEKRVDSLYLRYDSEQTPVPTVTFYGGSNVIRANVTAKYLNVQDGKYWYEVSIPKGADYFSIGNDPTQYPIYELKTKFSRYQKDYTLGNMQYSVDNSNVATLLYPIFEQDDEYTLTVGGNTISTVGSIIPVDESQVSAYANADAEPRAATTSQDVLPVLYETDSTNVSYSWTEGTASAGSWSSTTLTFNNTVSWTDVWVKFWGTGRSAQDVHMVRQNNTNIWTLDLSSYVDNDNSVIENIIFHNGENVWNGSNQTQTLTSSGGLTNSGFGQTFTPNLSSKTEALAFCVQDYENVSFYFANPHDSGTYNYNAWSGYYGHTFDYFTSGNNRNAYYVEIPSGHPQLLIINWNGGNNQTVDISLNANNNYGAGLYFTISGWDNGKATVTTISNPSKPMPGVGNTLTGSWTGGATYSGGTVQTSYNAAYQVEDRYGYISSVSGTTDSGKLDNFIYVTVPDSISTPYIKFYDSSNAYIGTVASPPSGVTSSSNGILLNGTDMKINNVSHNMLVSTDSVNNTKTYRVRLPKNAQSFTIYNGTIESSTAYDLYGSVTVSAATGELANTGDTVTVTNFHHAGSTFSVAADLSITNTAVRANTPVQSDMDNPLNTKSDSDFVFLTVPSGNSWTPYAYFYGNKDGEYDFTQGNSTITWPGVRDSGSYTDRAGNTVYRFQIPKNENGTYTRVMFNNGTYASDNITESQPVTAGGNYTLDTTVANKKDYGTSVKAFALQTGTKAPSTATVDYSSGDYIYIINNGTQNLTGSTVETGANSRFNLDEMHVTFFSDANGGTVVGTGSLDAATNAGYIPDKVGTTNESTGVWQKITKDGNDIYRIQVPSGAKYFQINNGLGKGNSGSNYSLRKSEIKTLTVNGLYKFVDNGAAATDYIKSGETLPTGDNDTRQNPHYLLDLVNILDGGDEELPTSDTVDIHLATVVTGSDGKIASIKWLKDSLTNIDSNYLANANGNGTSVLVKKQGEYYWKEVVAPSGYKINTEVATFTIPGYNPPSITDEPINKGSLTLNKKLTTVKNSPAVNGGESKNFTFSVVLTAPLGTKWEDLEGNNDTKLTFQTVTNNVSTTATVTSDIYSNSSLTRTFSVSVPATGLTDFIIGNIPSGTAYYVTETSPTNYSSTPVAISETKFTGDTPTSVTATVEEMQGTIPSYSTAANNAVSYSVTNEHEVGMLTLKDIVVDHGIDALTHETATVNQPTTIGGIATTDWYKYDYLVTLTAPAGVELSDYISKSYLDSITGYYDVVANSGSLIHGIYHQYPDPSGSTNVVYTAKNGSNPSSYSFHIYVTSAEYGFKDILNIPLGTQYTVQEINPTNTYTEIGNSRQEGKTTWTKSGEVLSTGTAKYVDAEHRAPVETITNEYWYDEPSNTQSEVILTKTAKEKVGTIDIGDALAGAQFKLVKVNADGTTDDTLRFTLVTADNTNKYTLGSGTHNKSGSWLTTGTDGKMHIFNLVNGDYYLEEQKAPKGYSHLDSNVLGSDLKPTKKKIYFSVGENREVKEISATDEMEPSYIRLFEHINMKKDEWGNPTFIFKIKQTGYYAWTTDDTPEWKYTTTDSGKEILVALTVDDNKNITNVVKWFNPTGINFDEDKIDNTTYGDWLVEGTTDLEDYQGIFDIDSKGRIKVEPGSYEITRVPVSRYEFVTNGKTAAYDNDTLPPDWTEYTVNGNKSEKLKIGEDNNGTMVGLLEPGKTIDVHYYDKVGYYDKFSQVDEEINKFYTLDENTKANKTIKGIRVEDYKVDAPTSGNDKDSINNGNLITQALTTSPRFKAYYIYADGSEAKITDTNELGKFVISYKYDSTSGDKASFATDFSYNSTSKQIQVNNYSNYKNGVYTLKATYDNKFTTNFDIVFERS